MRKRCNFWVGAAPAARLLGRPSAASVEWPCQRRGERHVASPADVAIAHRAGCRRVPGAGERDGACTNIALLFPVMAPHIRSRPPDRPRVVQQMCPSLVYVRCNGNGMYHATGLYRTRQKSLIILGKAKYRTRQKNC